MGAIVCTCVCVPAYTTLYGRSPTTALKSSESLSALYCAVSEHSTAILNKVYTQRREHDVDDVRNSEAEKAYKARRVLRCLAEE